MEGQEGEEMPIIPLNSTTGHGTASSYGHGHAHMMIHHHHNDPPPPPSSHHMIMNHILIPSSAAASVLGGGGPPAPVPIISSTTIDDDDDDDDDDDGGNGDDHAIVPLKKMAVIRYRECLKNHAAAMGGNANDGCGEFMPSGEDGTLEALTCSACNCHRNFHRKEIHGGADHNLPPPPNSCDRNCYINTNNKKLFQLGHNHHHHLHHRPVGYVGPEAIGYHHHHHPTALISSSRPVAPHQMIMSYNMAAAAAESDEQDGNGGGGGGGGAVVRPAQMQKKRFRTKFTQEQKEKMLSFAEKAGWKIQKQEEGVVQQFCQEIGVKRRVLKVWMHNNKHNLAKKTAAATLLSNPPHTQSLETQDRNRG